MLSSEGVRELAVAASLEGGGRFVLLTKSLSRPQFQSGLRIDLLRRINDSARVASSRP